jgi:hypothetical protein
MLGLVPKQSVLGLKLGHIPGRSCSAARDADAEPDCAGSSRLPSKLARIGVGMGLSPTCCSSLVGWMSGCSQRRAQLGLDNKLWRAVVGDFAGTLHARTADVQQPRGIGL